MCVCVRVCVCVGGGGAVGGVMSKEVDLFRETYGVMKLKSEI